MAWPVPQRHAAHVLHSPGSLLRRPAYLGSVPASHGSTDERPLERIFYKRP